MTNSHLKIRTAIAFRTTFLFGLISLLSGCTGSGLAERFNIFGSRESSLASDTELENESEASEWDAPTQPSRNQTNTAQAKQQLTQVGAKPTFPAQQTAQRPVSAQMASAQGTAYGNIQPAAAQRSVPVLHTLAAGENLDNIVRQAPGVVLLDFYADWCGPCRKQGKTLHQLEAKAKQLGATIIKVDVDQHKEIAQRFQAERLPTLVVLKDGRAVKRKIGLTDSQTLSSWLAL